MANNLFHMYKVLFLLFSLLLVACSVPMGKGAMPPSDTYIIATRSLLKHGEAPNPSFRVNGFVIFATKATNKRQLHRYFSTCEAYVNTLDPTDSHSPKNDLLPTYWPVTENLDHPNCIELVRNYDYARASEIVAHLNAELGIGIGPYLVASGEGELMVLDMSTFSDDDIHRAMMIWKKEICVDPQNWEPRLSLIKFREVFRNMLQVYGDSILKYFG